MAIGNIAQLTLFSLILMRMSGFILFNPILGRRNIPARVKAGFIFILTLAVYSFSIEEVVEAGSTLEFMLLLIKEFMAGYVVGLVMHLFFFIVSFAGYIIDFQMGLSMATVYDPQSNAQMPVTGSLYQTWLILLFFAVDGHLALIRILLTSAEIVPYGGIVFTEGLALKIIDIFVQCVGMGIRLAMPMMAAEFLIEMGVGILNKVVPQISIFVINIQMKLIVGTGLLVLLFAPTGEFIEKIMTTMMKSVQGILTFL